MSKSQIQALILTLLTSSITVGSMNSMAADDACKTEKCYGISKKGMNDCAGDNHPCQGQAPRNNDPTDYIYVLDGTCHKITGGIKKE
jgi:uncharacterized membrane protein